MQDRYKWIALSNTHAGGPAGDARRLDHADRDARHLPRHPPRPAGPGQQLLPALDDPRLPGRHQRADRQPRPARRHVRAGPDLQPRLRHLHRRLAAAGDRLDDRPRRARSTWSSSASSRASAAPACSPTRRRSSPTPFPPTSAGWRSGSTTSSASAACSSGSCSAGLLAPIDWRLVFLISVPVGLFGTVWAYLKLEERSDAAPALDRLVGQPHLRARPRPGDGRGHLRDPSLRRLADRLGEPAGARPARRLARLADRLRA